MFYIAFLRITKLFEKFGNGKKSALSKWRIEQMVKITVTITDRKRKGGVYFPLIQILGKKNSHL